VGIVIRTLDEAHSAAAADPKRWRACIYEAKIPRLKENLMNSWWCASARTQRVSWFAARAVLCAGLAVTIVSVGLASAASSINLGNGGDLHEGVGQADTKTTLARAPVYTANKFPVALKIHAPTPQWAGVQLESGKYRFIQLAHYRPPGTPPNTGRGYITLESATTATPSVSKTLANLRATPKLKTSPTKATRIFGLPAKTFDATVTATDGPGTGGTSINPFTVNHHCGFCTHTDHGETKDTKVVQPGERFRTIVLRTHGRTVVIYLESINAGIPRTFLPYVKKMLAHISVS
jgi:hypothetical protein